MKRVFLLAVLALGVMAPAARAETPRQTYERLWEKADRFYGAEGQPSPWVYFTTPADTKPARRTAMWVSYDGTGLLTVNVTPGSQRGLVNDNPATMKRALHEWAHIYQPGLDLAQRERGAALFASSRAQLLHKSRPKMPVTHWIARGQFGANYGANPRTIIFGLTY